jgi:hypothetical protein
MRLQARLAPSGAKATMLRNTSASCSESRATLADTFTAL